ncbi:preprotein translocase subunit SecB [Lactiplantibacillus garii]|uniref:Preprotein translocase subunit SecB n=1 Tax=Lactiplantibacillus garii TaxID=2306423 RepID=A0A426D4Z8_9LACO|nr:protein-export chaperone SecB [Lactiplantibacillus garii]RRK09757.1 preprotein translocase subunit SecB [Lactiplantibacillus garii]
MAVLEFKGYSVEELSYQKNRTYQAKKREVDLNPKVEISNTFNQDEIGVTVTVRVGSLKGTAAPFVVVASVRGTFRYQSTEDTGHIGVDTLVKKNAVAILYPYVRALVSSITNASNDYPAFILPTINVAQVLDERGSNSQAAD